jgi:hypothetical protein
VIVHIKLAHNKAAGEKATVICVVVAPTLSFYLIEVVHIDQQGAQLDRRIQQIAALGQIYRGRGDG